MSKKDLKTEYEYFIGNLFSTYHLGMDLCDSVKSSLENSTYPKYSEEYHNIEWLYFYLNFYLEELNTIIDNIENTIIFKEEEEKEEEKKNNIIILPLYSDEDIYVEEGDSIIDFWNKEF